MAPVTPLRQPRGNPPQSAIGRRPAAPPGGLLAALAAAAVLGCGCQRADDPRSRLEAEFSQFGSDYMRRHELEGPPQQDSAGRWYRMRKVVRSCRFEVRPAQKPGDETVGIIRFEFKPQFTAPRASAEEAAADEHFGPEVELKYDAGWSGRTRTFHRRDGRWIKVEIPPSFVEGDDFPRPPERLD